MAIPSAAPLSGFAGVMYASSYGAINPSSTGTTLGTTVLAAALAGGVNFGGKGTLLGGATGMLMITIINNGLIQINVTEYWVDAITGAIIPDCPGTQCPQRPREKKGG